MNSRSPSLKAAKQHRTPLSFAALALASLALTASLANAQIAVISSGHANTAGITSQYTYTIHSSVSAGSASKLVVCLGNYQSSGGSLCTGITFGGAPLAPAVEYDGATIPRGMAAIWYLDNPTGTGDIVATVAGGKNQGGIISSYLLLSGTAGGVSATAKNPQIPLSGTISTVTVTSVPANSLVVADNWTRSGTTLPTVNSPLQLLGNGNFSAQGGASGYQNGVSGSVSSSFTTQSAVNSYSVAAAFAPGAPTPIITAATPLSGSLSTTSGIASGSASSSVSGTNLTADITATAKSGFEVSSDNGTFGSTATFSQSSGSASGTLYVRLATTAAVGSHDSQTVATLSSSGAAPVDVASTSSGNTVLGASSVTTWPTASAIRLGQTLASSTLSGGSGSPTGTFAWTNATSAPVSIGSQSESVTFTPGDSNYGPTTGTASVLVQGGDGTWIMDGDGNWSARSNWQSNAVADGAGTQAWFTMELTRNRNITLDASHTLGIMNAGVSGGTRNYSFFGSGTPSTTLTFDNTPNSLPAQLNQSSAGEGDYFYLPVLLNSSLVISNAKADTSKAITFQSSSSITANSAGIKTISNTSASGSLVQSLGTIADGASGGTVAIVQNGSGSTLTLGGTNTYSGGTAVSAGTLNFSSFSAQPASGTLSIASGAIVNLSNSVTGNTWPKSTVTGAGTLNLPLSFSGFGVVSPAADMSGFSGIWNISGSGLVTVQSPFVSPEAGATIQVGSGTTLYLGWYGTTIINSTVKLYGADDGENLGQLRVENNAQQNGPVILNANSSIGSAGATGYIGGVISDGGLGYGFAKVGSGTVTLSRTNTYTGATAVNNGTLLVDGSLAADSAVTVNGGTLGGSGTIGGSVTVVTGTIAPGTTTGLLTVNGDASLATGTLAIDIDDTKTPKCDTLAVGGALDITHATLHLTVTGTATQTVYVIASYGSLTAPGTFESIVATGMSLPGDYTLNYNYNGQKKIALVKAGAASPYETWAGAGVAFTADANNDGVDNGLAWILGAANPSANGQAVLPTSGTQSGKLVLTFNCLSAANRGTALLKVQYSKDLGIIDPWTNHEAAVPGAVGVSDVGSVHFVATANGDLIHIVATIPASEASTSGSLFGRLTASEN